MDAETKAYVGFSVFPGIGPTRFRLLTEYFGSAEDAWNADEKILKKIKLGEKLTNDFTNFRRKFNIDEYISVLTREHISVLPITSARYPTLLKQIPDAPFLLYIRGKRNETPINFEKTIGVVGTRKITPYGIEITSRLTRDLVAYGFTIVSGLAYGVDAVAHQTAIDECGKTIAVLGCGVDVIAPPSNTNLYNEIIAGHGAIVSEMPLGMRPNKGLFPARNRIISGLSLGVVVTEGADDSGALITARNAGEQGREVFAVPGPITSPYSKGPLKLLKNGAKVVESVNDILDELGLNLIKKSRLTGDPPKRRGETKAEQKILDLLSDREMHIDDLARSSGLPLTVAFSTVSILEMKGVIRDWGDKKYGLAE